MPGIYGDLFNRILNGGFENWNQATIASTSAGIAADMWVIGLGTGSTYIASRASTGMDAGTFCCGITYTHTVVSDLHQVAQVLGEMKGQTVSFGIKAATITAGALRPFISLDGGTTRTYGNLHTGSSATVYETLKVEGVAVPSTATAVWYGVELLKTCSVLLDTAVMQLGSAVDTAPAPMFGKSAAWTSTSGATVRVVDATATATSAMNIIRTLVMDLQNLGILQ